MNAGEKRILIKTIVVVDAKDNITTSVNAVGTNDKLTMLRCLNMGIDAVATQMSQEQAKAKDAPKTGANILAPTPGQVLHLGGN